MNERDRIILNKIKAHIDTVIGYTHNMSFDTFIQDSKTVNATAFLLGQIGELSKIVSNEIQDANPQIQWRGIRGLRNRIVHDYENIDMNMFWEVIHDDLPKLSQQLEGITLKNNHPLV
jgi:uncharacterized protein with HEPN domain